MSNENSLIPTLQQFQFKVDNEDFVIDKSGVKTVEILGATLVLDPMSPYLDFNGRKTPKKYVEAELQWYDSMDLSVKDIGKTAEIWNKICDKDQKINSNYGYLIYSEENHNQYLEVFNKLQSNPDTRQAVMIYNRPTMHRDAVANGMSDFICTLAHQFFIRHNRLHSIVTMRSCDFVFGFFNDFAWFATVHQRLLTELRIKYPTLESGNLMHISGSLHIYERHFPLLKKMVTNEN